jgi:hypothetical protein
MAEKTLRLYFQTNSDDGVSPVAITVNGATSSVSHTKNWSLTDDSTGSVYVDVAVTTSELSTSAADFATAEKKTQSNLEISVAGGTALLVGMHENYLNFNGELTNENFDTSNGTCVINNQPTVNDAIDTSRYDISGHIPAGGELGQGNLPIYADETVKFSVSHFKRIVA